MHTYFDVRTLVKCTTRPMLNMLSAMLNLHALNFHTPGLYRPAIAVYHAAVAEAVFEPPFAFPPPSCATMSSSRRAAASAADSTKLGMGPPVQLDAMPAPYPPFMRVDLTPTDTEQALATTVCWAKASGQDMEPASCPFATSHHTGADARYVR